MDHAPRYDVDHFGLKPKLASFANNYSLQLWLDSVHKSKIFIGNHTLDSSPEIRNMRFTDEQTGKYDGVHMYGSAGKTAYTESVLNILLSAFQTQSKEGQMNQSHNSCPQSNYMKKQNKRYNVKVSNKFTPLSNFQGNF